ncbi:hypothetical protein ARMGADRAFT_350634 [Armillaria gallica]|uniref:Uncharacterized protein n=1 Tax=Armillaria gallica TaxID=47427 RepID=A0A2H3D5L0_ARMGA|nr:hypothetical protein ARMGADRAFT_350634 [Armillaria gallica]
MECFYTQSRIHHVILGTYYTVPSETVSAAAVPFTQGPSSLMAQPMLNSESQALSRRMPWRLGQGTRLPLGCLSFELLYSPYHRIFYFLGW